MRRITFVVLLAVLISGCNLPGSSSDTPTMNTPPPNNLSGTVPPVQATSPENAPKIAGCSIFPYDNIWNTPIAQLPVDSNSQAYIQAIGADDPLHPDFGSGKYEGGPIGIPYVTVSGNQELVPVSFEYDDESDPGPYPIPPNAPIEGGPDSDGDRHVLVVDQDNCMLYELFYAFPEDDGSWSAASGAIYDLTSNALRPETWTSADAAGLPILPGLIRYEEVAAGKINHALRFTAPQTRQAYIWPARHFASDLTDENYPPMGQRFRLRSDFDASGFSPEVQVIIEALKTYGMILTDNGSPWFISGSPNEAWNNDVLGELKQITGSDFEAVDVSSLMINPDSGQAKVTAPQTSGSQPGSMMGYITYTLGDGTVYRIASVDGAVPEDISAALNSFSSGTEDWGLNISPNGKWMVVETNRFGCADWSCLAVMDSQLTTVEAVIAGGDVVHVEGTSAIASGGNLIVYPAPDGPHDLDLWAVQRQGDQWSTPQVITGQSTFNFNGIPSISDDGQKVVFNCSKSFLGEAGTSICEVGVDGSGFQLLLSNDLSGSVGNLTALFHPDYDPQGNIVFEGDLDGEQIWRVSYGNDRPQTIAPDYWNDNSPCVLPDGRIVSLWLDRPGGQGDHELKLMDPDGSNVIVLLPDMNIHDIGLGCGG
jgi:hypothetical protein